MSENKYQSFTALEIWQKGRILKNEIFELAKTFPLDEKYRLTDQIIRSVRSIISNIAEGHGRFTYKDQLHFCIQARGSLSETYNHLLDALDCRYISENQKEILSAKIEDLRMLINGYISFLRSKT